MAEPVQENKEIVRFKAADAVEREENMDILMDIVSTVVWGALGLALMFLAKWVIDLAVPYDFPKEIKEGNTAAGFMVAGIFIAVAIIVRTVIM